MIQRLLSILIACMALQSCNSGSDPVNAGSPSKSTIIKKQDKDNSAGEGDTVRINYQRSKQLLELLPLIPDSAMKTWSWSRSEREELVRSVSKNNYFIDSNPLYNNVIITLPDYFLTQVVDGQWSVALYKISPSHCILITDDIAGDSNYINAFECYNKSIKALPESFINFNLEDLLIDKNNQNCRNYLLSHDLSFKYDFSGTGSVVISSSFLDRTNSGSCLKGNVLRYKFNVATKAFELAEVSWTRPAN